MPNIRTNVSGQVCRYSNRNLPIEIMNRMRAYASREAARRGKRVPIEEVCNDALARGLSAMEDLESGRAS